MLSYEEFKEKFAAEVKAHLPEKYKDALVDIINYPKNGKQTESITIHMPEQNSGASLELKNLYADYVQSGSVEKTLVHYLQSILPYMEQSNTIDISKILDWENAKELIVPELVSTRREGMNLEELVYRKIEGIDLAITYRIRQEVADIVGGVQVNKKMMEEWKVDENRIYGRAFHNMNRLNTPVIVELSTYMDKPEQTYSELPDKMECTSSYVFTNKEHFYGAATIMEGGLLSKIAERLKDDFYLLPMDVDNIVVCPKSQVRNLETLHGMVLMNNIQNADERNYLSDQVYLYDKGKGTLSMATSPENTQDVIFKMLARAVSASQEEEDYGEEQ